MKHKLTKRDFLINPILNQSNYKIGDTIEIPDDDDDMERGSDIPVNQTLTDDETDPPGGIEIPKKPPPVPE